MIDISVYGDMLIRCLTGWFGFIALVIYIHDRETFKYVHVGAIGVKALCFGMFWISLVTTFATLGYLNERVEEANNLFISFTQPSTWYMFALGGAIVNLSIGAIALACRYRASARVGRKYMRGLE